MKITAQDLLRLGIIDGIVVGADRRRPSRSRRPPSRRPATPSRRRLHDLGNMGPAELRDHRADKFLTIGRKL